MFKPATNSIQCRAQVETHGQTGVEMEALTAVQIGLLTIYDMCKAVDRGMVIGEVRVLEKHGGKSGSYVAGDLSASVRFYSAEEVHAALSLPALADAIAEALKAGNSRAAAPRARTFGHRFVAADAGVERR